jgi:hypothetical protein
MSSRRTSFSGKGTMIFLRAKLPALEVISNHSPNIVSYSGLEFCRYFHLNIYVERTLGCRFVCLHRI